ncbi:hypothetical protein [Aeromonas veronii]|uniref:hypothetical protein n=1 Tax=Aeromonas veronii TaxID=654 RepID=UPI001F3DBA51|nr:hypothetical protein [Aeromonas veronii]
MSDAIKIASQAPKLIEGLLADMFAARADDNRVCLGSVWSGPQHIQIQLVTTSSPDALLDDDSSDDEYAEPNELVQPKSGLWLHWQSYRADYIGTSNTMALTLLRCSPWGRSAPSTGWHSARGKLRLPPKLATGGKSALLCTGWAR